MVDLRRSGRAPIVLQHGLYVAAFRIFSRGYACLGIALGVMLVLGGSRRFQAPSMATAREIPGEHLTWGVIAAVFGLAMLIGSLLRIIPLLDGATMALSTWHLFFSVTLAVSASRDPAAAVTGITAYLGYAAAGWVLLGAVRQNMGTR